VNKNKDVDAYIAAAPEEHQPLLKKLRAAIRKALPSAQETVESKMPVYKVNGEWFSAFAWRAKGVMFYICRIAVVDAFADRLGKHRSGKSCIEMKPSKALSAAELESLATQMLAKLAKLA